MAKTVPLMHKCRSFVVVLDRKDDKSCDTGQFELIYRQANIIDPIPGDLSFMVLGRRMKKLRGKNLITINIFLTIQKF